MSQVCSIRCHRRVIHVIRGSWVLCCMMSFRSLDSWARWQLSAGATSSPASAAASSMCVNTHTHTHTSVCIMMITACVFHSDMSLFSYRAVWIIEAVCLWYPHITSHNTVLMVLSAWVFIFLSSSHFSKSYVKEAPPHSSVCCLTVVSEIFYRTLCPSILSPLPVCLSICLHFYPSLLMSICLCLFVGLSSIYLFVGLSG